MGNKPNQNIKYAAARDTKSVVKPPLSFKSNDWVETTFTLTEKEALLCAFYDNAPLLMGVIEPCNEERDVCFLSVNRAVGRMIGRSPLAMRGKSARASGVPPEFIDPFVEACKKAQQKRRAVRFSVAYHFGAGSSRNGAAARHLEVTVSPMTEPEGSERFLFVGEDVTLRHEAERRMRLLQSAVENAHDAFLILQAPPHQSQRSLAPRCEAGSPHVVYANPAFRKMTGYVTHEIVGQTADFLLPEGCAMGKTTPDLCAMLTDGQSVQKEIRLQCKGGKSIWVEMSVRPAAPSGTETEKHWIAVLRDISARKQAESAMRLRDRAIEHSSCGIVILDAQKPGTPIIYVNAAYETMTGYAASEILGKSPGEVIDTHASDPGASEAVRDAIANERELHRLMHNVRRNGKPLWRETRLSPVRCEETGRVTHFVSVQTDVTERQQSQITQTQAEARLRHVVQNLPLMAFAVDAGGVFTFFEGKGMERLGLEADHIVGRVYKDVFPHDDAFCAFVENALKGEATTFTQNVGSLVFETTCNPLRDPYTGQVASVIGFVLDVTQRTFLESQILQNDKLVALGQLVAGVAHEINNPLAAISGHAQLLALHPDEEVQADAQAIKSMTDRAVAVVRSMLAFARPSKGTDKERCLTTLRALTEDTLHLTQFALRTSDINVHLDFVPNEPPVFVNANQIQQIILNLVTNAEHALRSAPADSDRHIIILTELEEEGYVSLSVSDNGCGIPIDLQKRIFDPFFTTKDVGEGTGLGLSICHGIASSHKGSLHVESSEGIGTAFTLRLPVAEKIMGLGMQNTEEE